MFFPVPKPIRRAELLKAIASLVANRKVGVAAKLDECQGTPAASTQAEELLR
jgi:hypothetical protein